MSVFVSAARAALASEIGSGRAGAFRVFARSVVCHDSKLMASVAVVVDESAVREVHIAESGY